jgi:hypothetical protein
MLQFLVERLDRVGIPHMVTGSVASSYHGEPRATYDIDVVIQADLEQIDALVHALGPDCYVSVSAAREAVRQRTMFNVVHHSTGIKADLIICKARPFSVTEFERRRPAVISGVPTFVVTAEDCILSKLEWSKLGESERQYRDAWKIASVHGLSVLDIEYLQDYASELQVDELLTRLLREAARD